MMATGTAQKYAQRSGGAAGPSVWRGRARRDQLMACLIGAALLAGSVVTRVAMVHVRSQSKPELVREDPESQRALESLAVTFPRLVLGGMRGIVSTYLWMQAEDDKNNRKWEQLETRYDIIGALQPYFASVYIYHAWNQAYNLSAQWNEQDSKYKWVLDGLTYLYKGEDFNPGNPDINVELAHLYFLKLGGAFERIFYREHWREDLARLHELNGVKDFQGDNVVALHEVREIIHRTDARDKSDFLHVQELHSPEGGSATGWGIEISDPSDPTPSAQNPLGFNLFKGRTDGKKATEPVEFRHGVSPFYFAYCEYKRTMALSVGPTYTGKQVIDSFPAMSLRMWCRDDVYYMGELIDRMFGPHMDAALVADQNSLNDRIDEATDCARNVAMIGPRAIDLFNDHLNRYPMNITIHKKHIMETQAFVADAKAELKLLSALVDWRKKEGKLDNELVGEFQAADDLYKEAAKVSQAWVDGMYPVVEGQAPNADRDDSERYVNALQDRSRGIEALLTLQPGQKPDFGFLDFEKENLVEK